MKKILVSGLINLETTLKIDTFPIDYTPVKYPFFGVRSTISGVGFNIAKSLSTLGDNVNFLSLTSNDLFGNTVKETLKSLNIPAKYVVSCLDELPQSVILYDIEGRRQINVDLKDIQERIYPEKYFEYALDQCEIAIMCNINFSRSLLKKAKASGKLIATDVHTISFIDDEYNKDFMAAADILFMSHEFLPVPPEEWVQMLADAYDNKIIIVSMGSEGVLMYVKKDQFVGRFKAVHVREIVNTIGAGDALFSSFIHYYNKTKDPYTAIRKATIFASYKIGERGAAEGFLTETALEELCQKMHMG